MRTAHSLNTTLVLVVAAQVAIIMQRQAHPEKRLPEWEELCALGGSVQNFHLMATSLGIAGYWSSWNPVGRDSEVMARFLGLEPEDRCLGFFCLASSDRIGKRLLNRLWSGLVL